jgi:two-component system chemotaxis response regulator CheB
VIRVLVAEDSAVTLEYLVDLLEKDPALQVAGRARNGEEAVELVEALRPDVVVMDVEMPRMHGYVATRKIMESVPTPIVMVSAVSSEFEAKAFEALRSGALVLLNKPEGPAHPQAAAGARELVATVKLMAEVKVVRRWPTGEPAAPRQEAFPVQPARKIRVVAIGASAGGPPTVAEILARLPGDLPCPILLVQHIAPGFAGGLAEWLRRSTPLAVKLAEPDEPVRAGVVYVAADAIHLGISATGRIHLTDELGSDGFRPSASHLMRSVARSYGSGAVGVLLTGMGRDGAAGLLDLREAGGVTIAQDKASSVVFGMPMEAIRLGAAEHVLPPRRIAEAILTLVKGGDAADRRKDE